jgi:light-independent protochlorophyllide reductase subunit B
MKLTVWTYEGPPHVGAMRVATGMKGLHYVLHAPQGDTYADLLFTMIERRDHRPPVTYTTFQARDLGEDTANLFKTACQDAYDRFQPQALIVGASCTAELIQDDPGGWPRRWASRCPVVAAGTARPISGRRTSVPTRPSTSWSGRWRGRWKRRPSPRQPDRAHRAGLPPPRRYRAEITRPALRDGDRINVAAPLDATPRTWKAARGACQRPDVSRTRETAAATWSGRMACPTPRPCRSASARPAISWPKWPGICGVEPKKDLSRLRQPWWSASVDSTYLTGKRVFLFGDATHVKTAARIARDEMGFEVVGLGCYNREFARHPRAGPRSSGSSR